MLKKKYKLKREDFDNVFKNGVVRHSPNLTTRLISMRSSGDYGFSVVISKKVAKSAFSRNTAKRKVYRALSEIIPTLNQAYKGVIILKPGVIKLSKEETLKELKEHLNSNI